VAAATPPKPNCANSALPIGAPAANAANMALPTHAIALLVLRTVRMASAQLCPPVMIKLSPTPRSRRPKSRIVTDTAGRLSAVRDSK